MKDEYRELFDEVKLSEQAKAKLEEKMEKTSGSKWYKGKKQFLKVAVLFLVVLAVGSTGVFAATYTQRRKMESEIDNNRAKISVGEIENKQVTENCFYDVKLEYVPEDYEQDKVDSYMYKHQKKNKWFSVILYHLSEEYETFRGVETIQELKTDCGTGYYGGKMGRNFAIVVIENTNYMFYIDGANMSLEEIKKVAQNASLVEVSGKDEIQASYIEWTTERKKEVENFMQSCQ